MRVGMVRLKSVTRSILVTGGAGFIGSWVVDELISDGHFVVVLDDLSGGYMENVNPRCVFVKGSINDKDLVNNIIKEYKIDYVYHLAAYAAEGLSHFIRHFNYRNNLLGSINLINASINGGVKRFLFTSSMAVYGSNAPPMGESQRPSPEDPYGVSKLAVEQDLKCASELFDLDYVIIRPHNVFGIRQNIYDRYRNVIGIFMNQIMHKQAPTIFGDGKQTRAFSNIRDVAPCIADALFTNKALGEIINVGAKQAYSVNDVALMVCRAMGSKKKPVHIPARYEVKDAHCTIEKSVRLLNYHTTVSLEEGIKEMADWALSKGPGEPKRWNKLEIEKRVPSIWRES